MQLPCQFGELTQIDRSAIASAGANSRVAHFREERCLPLINESGSNRTAFLQVYLLLQFTVSFCSVARRQALAFELHYQPLRVEWHQHGTEYGAVFVTN